MSSGVTTWCAWPGRGESVTELIPFLNFLVHSYTCCSDRHASPYLTSFVDEFRPVSPLHYLKNGWQNAVLLWCMFQAGPQTLHYYCAVVLQSCIVLPPVGHSSNHEYHCCQLTRQSSWVLNFYRTFKVFIWLFLVHLTETNDINFRVRDFLNSSIILAQLPTSSSMRGLLIYEHSCHLCRD